MKGLGKVIPIEQPPALRKMSPPKDELEELEVVEESEVKTEEKKDEKRAAKRQRRNERKRAEKLKRGEEERERLKAEGEEEKREENGEQTEVKETAETTSSEGRLVLHKRQKPKDPPLNPDVFQVPVEDLGLTPLMLTSAPSYITLQDMEDIEAGRSNSSPGGFVYRVSIANGGEDHPFKDICQFARKRQSDLNVMVVVSEIMCSRNHEDILCLESKPGRVSYNCKLEVSELHAPYGKCIAWYMAKDVYSSLATLEIHVGKGERPPKQTRQHQQDTSKTYMYRTWTEWHRDALP